MERCGNTIRNGLPEREDIVFVVTAISQASLVTVAAARGRSRITAALSRLTLINVYRGFVTFIDKKYSVTQPKTVAGQEMGALLWSYVGPAIFAVGVVGNALVLVAMAQQSMRGTSTCVYL